MAVLSGWHYQNKSYPVVEIGSDSSIILSFFKILFKFYFERLFKIIIKKGSLQCPLSIYCLIFFVTTTTSILKPPPPPLPLLSLQTEIVVQFYPWSKCYFLLFSTHYHTLPYPKTYLPWQLGKLPVRESRDANLSCKFWRLYFSLPPPLPVNSPTTPTTPPSPHPAPKLTHPLKGIV